MTFSYQTETNSSSILARVGTVFRLSSALITAPDRRNGRELAEYSGDFVPGRTQRLLYRSHWDEDAVRDEHVLFAKEHLGSSEGMFIHDETGFPSLAA